MNKDYFLVTFSMWDTLTNFFPGHDIKRKINKDDNGVSKVTTYFKIVIINFKLFSLLLFLA